MNKKTKNYQVQKVIFELFRNLDVKLFEAFFFYYFLLSIFFFVLFISLYHLFFSKDASLHTFI